MKSLIKEVAITPEVFEPLCYDTAREHRVAIRTIFDALEGTGLVSNLADGQWISYLSSCINRISPAAFKLIKFLAERDRLVDRPKFSESPINTDRDWFLEAISLAEKKYIDGVITTEDEFANNKAHPLDLDDSQDWWIKPLNLQKSVNRNIEEYITFLKPLLLSSKNRITIYDRYLFDDKPDSSYRDFSKLISVCKDNKYKPLIELHRAIPSPKEKEHFFSEVSWKSHFSLVTKVAQTYGLNIYVNIWDSRTLYTENSGPHPRFISSKIGSFQFDHGFSQGRGKNRISIMNKSESDLWQGNFRSTTNKPVFSFKL